MFSDITGSVNHRMGGITRWFLQKLSHL